MSDLRLTLKRLWPFIRPYKNKLWIILLSGALMAGLAWAPIELVNRLLQAFETKDHEAAKWIPYSFPLLFVFLGSARYIHTRVTKYTTELVIARLRRSILEQFVCLNLSFHNSFESGSGGLLSRILSDTAILQEGLYFLVAFLREPITIIVILVKMIMLNWQLTAFTFIFAPFFIILMRQVRRSLRKYGHLNREAMDGLTSTLKESLDGVRVIQSFNLEDQILERFDQNQNDFVHTRGKIIGREEAVSPINEFVGAIAMMGFALVGFHQIFGGSSTPAEFVAFVMAAGIMQPPIKNLQASMVKLQQTFVVCDRLFDLVGSTSRVPQVANPKPFPQDWKSIRFRNVSFAYGQNLVLKNVNLTVQRGEVVALVGESGSGKSTLVNMLERFFDPSTGDILIDDVPLREFDLKDLRTHIALVTQDVFLFRGTIAHNIHAGNLQKNPAQTMDAAKLANAHGFIATTTGGYESQVGERGGLLSGGEKQRVSIARAIFKDAPILILDEATSALDSVSELEVQKGLNQLMQGRTAFVIAHRLSTIFNADRILVMKNGEIVEQGSHDDLIKMKGEYFNFFSLQMNHEQRRAHLV